MSKKENADCCHNLQEDKSDNLSCAGKLLSLSSKVNNVQRCEIKTKYGCCCWCCKDSGIKYDYEMVNILSENGDSIYSPEHDESKNNEYGPRNTGGQIYVNAELIETMFAEGLKFRRI